MPPSLSATCKRGSASVWIRVNFGKFPGNVSLLSGIFLVNVCSTLNSLDMAKNIVIAYVLWLVGGWLGLHLFYLGRDRHAFTWWCTAGGCFGIGWLRDLVRIPEYVEDANDEHSFTEFLKARIKRGNPSFSIVRFIGEVMVGWLFGHLLRAAIPEDVLENQFRSIELVVPNRALGENNVER